MKYGEVYHETGRFNLNNSADILLRRKTSLILFQYNVEV